MSAIKFNASVAGSKSFTTTMRQKLARVPRIVTKQALSRSSADAAGIAEPGVGAVPMQLRGANNIQPAGRLTTRSSYDLEAAYNLPAVPDIDIQLDDITAADVPPSVMDTLCLCSYEDEELDMLEMDVAAGDDLIAGSGIDTLCICSYDDDDDATDVFLDTYNSLRQQLQQLLAVGARTPQQQAQIDRVRHALFTSIAVAFRCNDEEPLIDAEDCDEDDVLCWVG